MDTQSVAKVIEEIRPMIQSDGGDIELLDVDSERGIVKIKFKGACVGCPLSPITLQAGIQYELKQHFPELTEVQAVSI